MKKSILTLAMFSALSAFCSAAAIGISIDSGGKSLQNENGVPLSGGNVNVNRDGTQVILGYFSDATAGAPFGTGGADAFASFVPLTGPGSPAWGAGNAVNNFTIGDDIINGTGNGELFKDTFAINTGVADSLLPAAGTPLILRFFNASGERVLDLANPGLWTWKLPATPASSLNISLDDNGLVSRGTGGLNDRSFASVAPSSANLRTLAVTPVPEPTSVLLMLGGASMMLISRRRRK